MWRRLKASLNAESVPVTHAAILGQVWRGRGAREVLLSRALSGIEVRAVDQALGRAAGELLARAGSEDVIDAALALLAQDGDEVVTSDPADLERLLATAGRHVELVVV